MSAPKSEFVTPQEAAGIAGCAVSTIYLAISQGKLSPVHFKTKLLRRSQVEKYKAQPVGAPSRTSKTA